ncbi:MAG: 1-acyl-sn-glycerol-3-phosphate acyltransferase [Coriobacteriales bacterium]|jgi:1-acyl-sn-glycerol-3-phosphate acyltransferase|nr:1-acyl-sn-glycerol-3-phosphate acyltransferase [Coriobacteriales bacterium]
MRPLDSFYDSPAEGPGHYPQRFCSFFFVLVRVVFGLLFRVRSYDTHHVRPGVSYLVAGNHRSYLDPVFVMMAMRPRPVRYMAKEEFFKVRAIARLASWVGAFPVKRDAGDMQVVKRSVAMLKRGELVGIFPEGTRGRDASKARELHEGVAVIARLAKCEVVPVRIWGAERIAPPGSRRWHFPRITLRFGEPMSLAEARYEALDKPERLSAFTADVMKAVYALEDPRKGC